MNRPSPQLMTFSEFAAKAAVVPLLNHGRAAEVLMDGLAIGFVDHLGEAGLRQSHRADVNNALFFNQPAVSPQQYVAPPKAVVLKEYPELRERFPAEYDFIVSNDDVEVELLALADLKVYGPTVKDHEATHQLQHMHEDASTELLVVRCPGAELILEAVGAGASSYFQWVWSDGDALGDVLEELPCSVLAIVRDVLGKADLL